jgi:hypothetical protein
MTLARRADHLWLYAPAPNNAGRGLKKRDLSFCAIKIYRRAANIITAWYLHAIKQKERA